MEVTRMLDYLWMCGSIAVVGREGQARVWDLSERWLPEQRAARPRLSVREAVSLATERSLRGLGIGTKRHISEHFVRGRYPGLETALRTLVRHGRVVEAEITGDEGEPLARQVVRARRRRPAPRSRSGTAPGSLARPFSPRSTT